MYLPWACLMRFHPFTFSFFSQLRSCHVSADLPRRLITALFKLESRQLICSRLRWLNPRPAANVASGDRYLTCFLFGFFNVGCRFFRTELIQQSFQSSSKTVVTSADVFKSRASAPKLYYDSCLRLPRPWREVACQSTTVEVLLIWSALTTTAMVDLRHLLGLQLHGTWPNSCILQEEVRRKWETAMARETEVAASGLSAGMGMAMEVGASGGSTVMGMGMEMEVAASGVSAVMGMEMEVAATGLSAVVGMEMEVAASGVSAVMGMVMEVAASGRSSVTGVATEVAASGLFKHPGIFDLWNCFRK